MKSVFKKAFALGVLAVACQTAYGKTITYNTDIAIVGGGSTGLAAAVTGAEAGAKVIVLEKNPYLGGSSNFAEGLFGVESDWQRGKSYGLTKDEAFEHIIEYSHFNNDASLIRKFVDDSADNLNWLHERGVDFDVVQISPKEPETWHLIQNRKRFHHGAALVTALQEHAEKDGVEFLMRTPAKSLIYTNGKVTGVRAKDHKGNDVVINAKAVIIGSGGFGNSPDKIDKWTKYNGANFKPTLPLNKTGDGIEMAKDLGAAHEGETLMLHPGTEGKGIVPLGNIYTMTWQPANMWVNAHGKRFTDETVAFSFAHAGNAIGRQLGNYAWAIFDDAEVDHAIKDGVDNGVGVLVPVMTKLGNIRTEIKNALAAKSESFFAADNIEQLAKEINVPVANLKASYAQYNNAANNHYDEAFLKDRMWTRPLNHGKLYAVKLMPYHFTSVGGLKVTNDMQVVNTDEKPITGLYAGGNDVGGLYSDTYTLWASGHAFAFATYSGREAAKHAVEYIKQGK
ncbi:FAD-dependent oxidoreductase [Shewanella avicenniae]|uniref:FAD-dependent oxidoreductase n=1 Tax=Shewanella avicenniae TaxID=2814294 RepID=A0ABX7QU93_9GAMM|nr:FAD-dependent oxidoreductase [Shewanella avicenniae]QSX34208.1 FAD-dependent oxidoreductase [Shewanella avicenniae]